MPTSYKNDCGKQISIGFSEADSCKAIQTENVYNIILICKGSLILRVNGQRIKGEAPCIVTLKENLNVEFVSSRKLAAQSIQFDIAFLYRSATFEAVNSGRYENLMSKIDLVPIDVFYSDLDAFSYVLPVSKEECAQANTYFASFYNAILNQTYVRWSCQARQNLNGLLELIHQIYLDFINSGKQGINIQNSQEWVRRLLKIIHTNYPIGAQLSLASLSKEIGINKDTVSKRFKEVVGCSVGNYIIDYRIKCACHSLSNTEISIKEIASKCGFGNEVYFIRQFQKRKGMTPTQYREKELRLRREELSRIEE